MSSGQSGGEKAKLAFTILVAAIAYQYDLDPEHPAQDRFRFVVVDGNVLQGRRAERRICAGTLQAVRPAIVDRRAA